MRDREFVAVHRGGLLTKDRHRQLMRWARECAEHALSITGRDPDPRLVRALQIAKEWEEGSATVGEARNAAIGAIAAARESLDPVTEALTRAAGHAVATAHMADHAPGAADYVLKAVKLAGGSIEEERRWQDDSLAPEIRELVITARQKRHLRL